MAIENQSCQNQKSYDLSIYLFWSDQKKSVEFSFPLCFSYSIFLFPTFSFLSSPSLAHVLAQVVHVKPNYHGALRKWTNKLLMLTQILCKVPFLVSKLNLTSTTWLATCAKQWLLFHHLCGPILHS